MSAFSLGLALVVAASTPTSPPAATPLEAQCKARQANACRQLGEQQAKGGEDARAALASYARGCELGDAASCTAAGTWLETASTLARDPAGVRDFFRKACAGADADGCLALTTTLDESSPEYQAALERATSLAKKRCEAGELDLCRSWVEAQTRGKHPLPPEELTRLNAGWCNRGANWACGLVALAALEGEGAPRDLAEAKRLARPACQQGDPTACFVMAKVARKEGDHATSRSAARTACEADSEMYSEACWMGGSDLLEGRGGAADRLAGVRLLGLGCSGGSTFACEKLAGLDGLDSNRRLEVAMTGCQQGSAKLCKEALGSDRLSVADRVAMERAFCERGPDQDACAKLYRRYSEGDGVAKDEREALRFSGSACSKGNPDACRLVARLGRPEDRLLARANLCLQDDTADCRPLVASFLARPAAEQASFWRVYLRACRQDDAQACAQLAPLVPAVAPTDASLMSIRLVEACEAGRREACRAAQAVYDARGAHTLAPTVALCRAGDAPSCLTLASRADGKEGKVWALAAACRAHSDEACSRVRSFGDPNLTRLEPLAKHVAYGSVGIGVLQTDSKQVEANRADVTDALLAALTVNRAPDPATWPENLGPFFLAVEESPAVKDWRRRTAPAATKWLTSLPRARLFAIVRNVSACKALREAGVEREALELPAWVDIAESRHHLVGLESNVRSITFGLCGQAWEVVDEWGSPTARGVLEPYEDYSRFRRVGTGDPTEPEWPVTLGGALGVEVLASPPTGFESSVLDSGSLVVRMETTHSRKRYFQSRLAFSLPLGRNPFGFVPGIGTSLGRVTSGPVQWRVLKLEADLWMTFTPGSMTLVPAAGTEVAFAVGGYELSLEVGGRYGVPILPNHAVRLPAPMSLLPYLALAFGF